MRQTGSIKPLSDEAFELIAAQFKVLSEPARLRLLSALQEREHNVTELIARTGIPQANASRHLRSLTEAGIVARRREGAKAYYRISDKTIFELCHCVCGSLQRRLEEKSKAPRLFA
jgi:ArsR family transcriptional regulator